VPESGQNPDVGLNNANSQKRQSHG
jgi:hypothetical protein